MFRKHERNQSEWINRWTNKKVNRPSQKEVFRRGMGNMVVTSDLSLDR